MGQMGISFGELTLELKDIGEKALHNCYSPEEIVKLVLEDEEKNFD